jgi:hypothetical protein
VAGRAGIHLATGLWDSWGGRLCFKGSALHSLHLICFPPLSAREGRLPAFRLGGGGGAGTRKEGGRGEREKREKGQKNDRKK